jgi:2-C-methyl-D-erythritol 4-phosphate cytidylyltransferase
MLVLASGDGTRFGGSTPKVYALCAGCSVVEWSVRRLAQVTADREIILAVRPMDREAHLDPMLEMLHAAGLSQVVDGGATRQESMERALAASDPESPLVLVHDAARPFFPIAAARAAIHRAAEVGAAVLALPVPDTLKLVKPDHEILQTLDRTGVWQAQTPQVIARPRLLRALAKAREDGFVGTDDASLLENAGLPVTVVRSSLQNIKITDPEDLRLAELLAPSEAEL